MFHHQYFNITANCYRDQLINSAIRIFHASPNTSSVDVYANGSVVVKNLDYKGFSQYLPIPAGNYNIKVYPSGEIMIPLINTTIYIPEYTVFNLATIGELPDITLYPIPEPVIASNLLGPCIRFVQLSPNSPDIDITLFNGTNVINNVTYKEITNYLCVPPETYSFIITPANSTNVLLDVPNIQLTTNNYYTMYGIGLVEKSPYFETLLVIERR